MSRFTTIAAVAIVATLALAVNAEAQQTKMMLVGGPQPAVQPYVQPLPPSQIPLPSFGFQSYNIQGYGERVTYVSCHGLASQLGLEPGDTILTLNGFPLTYHGAWNNALYNAMQQGGSVTLAIQDVRTGAVVYRSSYMGGGVIGQPVGPITPKSMPVAPPTMKNVQPGPGGPSQPNNGTTVQVGNFAKVQLPNLGALINKGN